MIRGWGILVLVWAASSCATLFNGGPEPVTLTSNPEGVEVMIDGFPVGRTPLTVEIDRKAFGQRIVTMRAAGYQTRQFPLQKSLNVTAIFNLTSLTFWATDATSGALISYEPNAYYFELQPQGAPPRPAGPGSSPYYVYTDAERRALYFTLINHRALREQIVRRRGEHLETLATLLGADGPKRDTFIAGLGDRANQLIREPYPHRLFREVLVTANAATATKRPARSDIVAR